MECPPFVLNKDLPFANPILVRIIGESQYCKHGLAVFVTVDSQKHQLALAFCASINYFENLDKFNNDHRCRTILYDFGRCTNPVLIHVFGYLLQKTDVFAYQTASEGCLITELHYWRRAGRKFCWLGYCNSEGGWGGGVGKMSTGQGLRQKSLDRIG